jgi:hypothetical protein
MPESEGAQDPGPAGRQGPAGGFEVNGEMHYVLPPPMAGFFEFLHDAHPRGHRPAAAGELFYQYLNQEEDFVRALFTEGQTQLGRAFVHEPALSDENALHVLDYERASEVIRTASHRGISMCYCRHKMMHMDRACAAHGHLHDLQHLRPNP